ncbi:MAG: SurA N-terminal domain-containing protein [Parachlamydiaceae bacterium]
MKNKILIALSAFFITLSYLEALTNEPLFSKKREEPKMVINNRILAKVGGKPISTYDLMKKMDLSFFRYYPEYTSSIEARFQFYEMSWKHTLSEMIDKELILADAQESKIEVSAGDVRQDIESSFGPNTIANLDKAGFTYEEAAKIMQEEILIRRLIGGRVQAKALRQVTPNKIRQAYDEFIQDPANSRSTQWSYRIVTVKDRTLQKTEETANKAYQLLMEGISLDQLEAVMKERKLIGRQGKITVSTTIKQNDKEISDEYRTFIAPLEIGMYSQPFANKSRTTKATVYRIFAVNDKIPGGVPSYREMESKLKEKLLDKEIDAETEHYLAKLRQHYHIRQSDLDDYLPPNYQPFILK